MARFIVGLDLGQAADFTALCVLEQDSSLPANYQARHVQRFPLGTSYPAIVERVARHVRQAPLRGLARARPRRPRARALPRRLGRREESPAADPLLRPARASAAQHKPPARARSQARPPPLPEHGDALVSDARPDRFLPAEPTAR